MMNSLMFYILCSAIFVLKLYVFWHLAWHIFTSTISGVPLQLGLFLSLHFLPKFLPQPMVSDVSKKAILVTGCDTGIGNALAKRLVRNGFHVFAGCLKADSPEAEELQKHCSKNLEILQLDVTEKEEVKSAKTKVEKALENTGKELWAVVNNAGIGIFGEMEWINPEAYQTVFNINVVGQIRVIQQFLPLLRESKGRIVNISSVMGLFSGPFSSPYCISKHGVEALGDSLRFELAKWGIKVILIEPGNFAAVSVQFNKVHMEKQQQNLWLNMSPDLRRTYGEQYFNTIGELLADTQKTGSSNIDLILDVIQTALMAAEYPEVRYMPGTILWRVIPWLFMYTPTWFSNAFYSIYLSYLWKTNKPSYKK